MEKLLYLFIHLVLPFLLLVDVLFRSGRSKMGTIARGSSYILALTFLYLWGQWAIIGSSYLKWLVVLIILLSARRMVINLKRRLPFFPSSVFTKILNGAGFLFAIFSAYLVFTAHQGRSSPQEGVEWNFPLGSGTYYVGSGGSNRLLNNHIRGHMTSQYYALDINKVGPWLGVSKRMLSTTPDNHHIYGEPVFAPCAGIITEAKSNVPDRTTSSMDVGPGDGMGNFVILDCNGVIASIPHLRQNSVAVVPGQQVAVGSYLGDIGLSGFAQEPHLHIQAAVYDQDSALVGIPITFGSRQLVRNDIIKIE